MKRKSMRQTRGGIILGKTTEIPPQFDEFTKIDTLRGFQKITEIPLSQWSVTSKMKKSFA